MALWAGRRWGFRNRLGLHAAVGALRLRCGFAQGRKGNTYRGISPQVRCPVRLSFHLLLNSYWTYLTY